MGYTRGLMAGWVNCEGMLSFGCGIPRGLGMTLSFCVFWRVGARCGDGSCPVYNPAKRIWCLGMTRV